MVLKKLLRGERISNWSAASRLGLGNWCWASTFVLIAFLAGSVSGEIRSVINVCGNPLCDDPLLTSDGVRQFVSVSTDMELLITGSDFRKDGVLVPGLENIGDTTRLGPQAEYYQLTGMLTDGTPMGFTVRSPTPSRQPGGEIVLRRTSLPMVSPDVITLHDTPPRVIRDGQILNANSLPDDFVAGPDSLATVVDGFVGHDLKAVGGTIMIDSSTVGESVEAFYGGEITISGASVVGQWGRPWVKAYGGGLNNLEGGLVLTGTAASGGGVVSISGGSQYTVWSDSDSRIRLIGDEFRLNGQPVTEDELKMTPGDLLTGIYADGSPFAHRNGLRSSPETDVATGGTTFELSRVAVPPPTLGTIRGNRQLYGIRAGQAVVIGSGDRLSENFNAGPGSTVVIEAGGVVGDNLELDQARLEMSGGMVEYRLELFNDSSAEVSGGSVSSILAFDSQLEVMEEGRVRDISLTRSDATVSGYGLSFNEEFLVELDSTGETITIEEPGLVTGWYPHGARFSVSIGQESSLKLVRSVPEPSSGVLTLLVAVGFAGIRAIAGCKTR